MTAGQSRGHPYSDSTQLEEARSLRIEIGPEAGQYRCHMVIDLEVRAVVIRGGVMTQVLDNGACAVVLVGLVHPDPVCLTLKQAPDLDIARIQQPLVNVTAESICMLQCHLPNLSDSSAHDSPINFKVFQHIHLQTGHPMHSGNAKAKYDVSVCRCAVLKKAAATSGLSQ